MDFAPFDTRGYRTVPVAQGYAEWALTYESVVQDEMDIRLFERLTSVDWALARRALDLACGTGRIGAWLRGRGVRAIDGLDLTPSMLERARARGVYASLSPGDVADTGLAGGVYDLIVQSLADEHLPDLVGPYGKPHAWPRRQPPSCWSAITRTS